MIRAIVMAILAFPVRSAAEDAPPCGLYTYRAEIVRVIDGDTVVANIDLGFDVWLHDEHLRLSRVQAAELGAPGGEHAAAALRARVEGRRLYICTEKMKRKDREARGSFGRYLVTIYDDGENVNHWLIEQGLARAGE
jgi:micrococcal nuclease